MPEIQLYARNNTEATITFNTSGFNWELPPLPDDDYIAPLPWEIAVSNGFTRIWEEGGVTVALDRDFSFIVNDLPSSQADHAFVWTQSVPVTTVDIHHGLGRPGPVLVSVCSLDLQTEWWGYTVGVVNENVCRVGFEDPTTFIATVV